MEKGFIPQGEWCLSGLANDERPDGSEWLSGNPHLEFGKLALGPETSCAHWKRGKAGPDPTWHRSHAHLAQSLR